MRPSGGTGAAVRSRPGRATQLLLCVCLVLTMVACTGGQSSGPAPSDSPAATAGSPSASPSAFTSAPPAASTSAPPLASPSTSPSVLPDPNAAPHDGSLLPQMESVMDWNMTQIELLRTKDWYAPLQAEFLVKDARVSLQETLELLSASGVEVTGSPGDERVYVEARKPWKTDISIRAGQAIAFHQLLASGATFSLREFLTMYQQLSHVQPDLRANVQGFAEGLLEELSAEDRNPVWAALILAGSAESSAIHRSLTELSQGTAVANITDAALDPAQLIMIILRMRQEAVGMLEILDGETQTGQPMTLQSFQNPRLAVETQPCEFDSPLSDAGAKGLSKAVGLGFKAFIKSYGDNPLWNDPDGRALTGKEGSQLISAISFWSSLLNLVLTKATTQLDLKVTPDPLTRTKKRITGDTAIVEVHAHRSSVPAGKYAVCAERMLAALGTSFKANEPGALDNVLATFHLQPGQPVMLTEQDVAQWTRLTDEHGVAKTSIHGRPQKEEIPDTYEEVSKEAAVAVSINPDTAEKWWETTFAAVVDAVSAAKLFRRLTPAPDPAAGLTGVTNAGLRAANYFGWLNNNLSFHVRDWEPQKVLRYSVAVQSETNIPRARCQYGHNEKLDYRLEAEVPLTARIEADGTTSLIGRAPLRWVAGVHDYLATWHTGEMSDCGPGAAGSGTHVCTVPPSDVYTSTERVTSLIDGEMGVEVRNYGKATQEVRLNLSPDTNSWAYNDTTVPAEINTREQNWHCEPPLFPPSRRSTHFLNAQQSITNPDLAAPLTTRLDKHREQNFGPRLPYEFIYEGFVDGVGSWAGLQISFSGARDVRIKENIEIRTQASE